MPDALDTIRQILDFYGLGSLAQRAWDQQVDSSNDAQIAQWLRQQPEYETRFPGLNASRAKMHAPSEAEWVAYEKAATGMFRAAGLSAGFYDQPDDFAKFINGEVSVAELQQRVQMAEQSVYNDFDTQAAAVYGLNAGDLTAMLLDPTRAEPIVERKFRAVQAAKVAKETTYGQLNATDAERIAALGEDPSQMRNQFGQLANQAEIFNPLNQGEQAIGRGDQIAAAFEGNATAQAKIQKQASRRKAEFDQGGEFSRGQRGYAGIGA